MDGKKGEIMTKAQLIQIKHYIEQNKNFHQKNLDKFIEDVKKINLTAFEWADDAFFHAAKLLVLRNLETYLNCNDDLRDTEKRLLELYNTLHDNILNVSRKPKRSTSPCANLASQELLRAETDMLIYMENFLKHCIEDE